MSNEVQIRFNLLKNIKIPIEIFELRKLSQLEIVVYYLTYAKKFKQNEIAFLLKRNPRTIWTALSRAEYKADRMKQLDKSAYAAWERRVGIQNKQSTEEEVIAN